jgi:hypothetical protein
MKAKLIGAQQRAVTKSMRSEVFEALRAEWSADVTGLAKAITDLAAKWSGRLEDLRTGETTLNEEQEAEMGEAVRPLVEAVNELDSTL